MKNWRKHYLGRPLLTADNFTADAGSGGDTFGADDIGGVKFPRSKIIIGADGTNDGDVSSANPLPVTGTITAVTALTNALPAGTNAIGKLAANSGVDIGDVDVTSVISGTGATNLGKAVDAVAGATDTGVAVLAVRDDALGALTPAEGDYVNLRVNSTGALHVTGGGGGTQYAVDDALGATPTGTLALAIRDDALSALTPVEGDGIGLRVDANGALWVIPSGTVTVASHAVTNAGTFAVQVDGAALTALQLIDDAIFAEDVAAQAADKGMAILAVRRDADTSLVGTDNDYANLQVDANGYLKVEIFDGGGSHTVDNAGTFAVQVDGAGLTALQLIDNTIIADDAAFTPGSTSVNMAGFQADETATDSVDEGDGGAARMTLDRKVIVTPQPHTSGGLTTARSLDLDETEEEIKASAGQVYGWNITNFHTATLYVKFYNATAANVVVGTTTPLFTLAIPGNSSDDTMLAQSLGGMGIAFDTAITWAATTGLADNDTGAPAASAVAGTVWYK